jgi:hypothetical protein
MPRSDPGADARPYIPQVVSVPKTGEITVCFCAPWDGIITHYTRDGTVPCPGEEDCPAAIHRIRPIFRGYAPVRVHVAQAALWVPEVLEVTEHLEEALRGRHVAGEVWVLSRKVGKRKTRPVVGRYLETRHVDGVFDPFDVRPVVHRMYHTDRIRWGCTNPVPPRLMLQAVEAPPPDAGSIAPPTARPGETHEEIMQRLRRDGARLASTPLPNGRK